MTRPLAPWGARVMAALAGAACARPSPDLVVELPTVAVTRWTDSTELYLEHPALVVGEAARFAIHLTDLTDFTPLTSGTMTLRLTPSAGGAALEATQDGPRSPGIFGATVRPEVPGRYHVTVLVRSPQAVDSIAAGDAEVFASIDEVPEDQAAPDGVAFLKEQQWRSPEFRTASATTGSVVGAVEVAGEIVPAAGRRAVVTAPVAGTLDPAVGAGLVPGARIAAGTTVAFLAPALGESGSALARARAELAEAVDEERRARRLVAAEAAPARRLDEATIRLGAAREALAALGGGDLVEGRLPVRAPISGVVADRMVAEGRLVAAGTPILTIVEPGVVWLRALVPAAVAPTVDRRARASIRIDGSERWIETGPAVAIAPGIDSVSRAVEMFYPIGNADGAVPIGATASVWLPAGGPRTGVVVPPSAVLEFDGLPVVFVQVAGERFESRPVRVAARGRGGVLLSDGVAAGERVVTAGGYQIRLASQSSAVPAHGHEH